MGTQPNPSAPLSLEGVGPQIQARLEAGDPPGKIGIVNRQVKLPQLISESRFNVLKPPGMSRGDFYELHYKVDESFNSARLPRKVGTGRWLGTDIGLQRHGQAGRLWYGSPRELKAAAAAPVGAGAAYWYLGAEDE